MATTATLTRDEYVEGFSYGGSCNIPEIDIINTDTNIVSTIKYDDKYLEFNSKLFIKAYLNNVKTSLNRFTNSELKAIRYTKILTPENFPDTREITFREDLQIVYDWENETGEKTFSFQMAAGYISTFAYATYYSRTSGLSSNACTPAVAIAQSSTTARTILRIYLNIKQTFTTTAAQNIKVRLMFRDGFEGVLTIPVVRAV